MRTLLLVFIFVTPSAFASDSCPADKAKANFIVDCSAALRASSLGAVGNKRTADQEHAICRCIAKTFSVENLASASCDYSFSLVYQIENTDKVGSGEVQGARFWVFGRGPGPGFGVLEGALFSLRTHRRVTAL